MPRHCSAGGCKSRDNRETRNAGITFHKLPKGAIRRKLWITNSHRTDSWDPQTDFVYFCSKHFTPDSFELTGCSGIRRLKEDAFPTVFESSPATKTKKTGIQQKQENIAVRKKWLSGQENHQQNKEEPTVQRSVAEAEESHENLPVISQELSGVEQLHQQKSSSPPPEYRPTSPSRYMRRLPPPAGFYLSKEHSYAQLCPLLWRRRYDQAIDCLEKALRQLHASRRRENRLRSTVMRLRDKRLKNKPFVSGDSCNNKGTWTPGGCKGRGRESSNLEDSETDVKLKDTGLFEDTCLEQMEPGEFLSDSKTWSEEEERYCFYCGREQVQVEGLVAPRLSKTGKAIHTTLDITQKTLSVKNSSCDIIHNTSDIQICKLGNNGETNDSTPSQILLHTQSLRSVTPARLCLTDPHKQKLLLSDACEGEFEAFAQEHQLEEFWVHGTPEGHVILVPVPPEDGLQNFVKMEDDTVKVQTILVSEVKLKGELEHNCDNSGDLTRPEAACDVELFDITSTLAERREDVRDKLKEHLEGFQLQLSTEFLN